MKSLFLCDGTILALPPALTSGTVPSSSLQRSFFPDDKLRLATSEPETGD